MVSERKWTFPGLGQFPAPCRGSEATSFGGGSSRGEAQPARPGAGRRRTGPGAAGAHPTRPKRSGAPRRGSPQRLGAPVPAAASRPNAKPRERGDAPAPPIWAAHREPVASAPKLPSGLHDNRRGAAELTQLSCRPAAAPLTPEGSSQRLRGGGRGGG